MCGIAGVYGRKIEDQYILEDVLNLLKRRGPDDFGLKYYNMNGISCQLLHTRLSIIDINKRSQQPFKIGNSVITFNGELYNYIELRKELINLGCKFKTKSDTEVILQSYNVWGEKCLDKFEGMWAFAILDIKKIFYL